MTTGTTTTKGTTPRATRAGRIAVYLERSFPPAVVAPYMLVHGLACYLGLDALAGHAPVRLGWQALIAAASVYLLAVLLRVHDDLGDQDLDDQTAAEGDPRVCSRPLMTGEVRRDDLVWLRNAIAIALVLANLGFAGTWAFPMLLGIHLYGWLSAEAFFSQRIHRNLLLSFLTHEPLLAMLQLYVLAVYGATHGLSGLDVDAAWLLLGLWLPWTGWEIGRKLRIPEDETGYQTYSQTFGRAAPLIPAALFAISCASLLRVACSLSLSWAYAALLVASAGVVIFACLRFLIYPSRRHAALSPTIYLYKGAANLGLLVAVIAGRGLVVS